MSRIHTSSTDELQRGFIQDGDLIRCLFCEATWEPGRVYRDPSPPDDVFRTAESAAQHHVLTEHGGAFSALLALGRTGHGLTPVQGQVLELMARGLSDKQIAQALGGRSVSTVRNHRFQLRRRAREARVYVAMMELLDGSSTPPLAQEFVEFHVELPTNDERTAITRSEADKLRDKYFLADGTLSRIPKKEKHKLVVLRVVVEHFESGVRYTEREMNERLRAIHADTAALRRYLVDYRFMQRTPSGSAYWRIDSDVA